jgi:hypothetical protein
MGLLNFDANQVAPSTGVTEALPAGWYNVAMDESTLKPTKDGAGQYLEIRFNVLDGQYVGRKLFSRLNIRNQNPVAQEIAYKDLSAICHAVGVLQVQDSQQLHGRPLKVKAKVRKATDDYEASNDLTAYKNINEVTDSPAGAASAPAGVPAGFGQPQFAPPAQQFSPQQQQAPQQPLATPPGAWQPPAAAQPWAAPQQQQAPQQAQFAPPAQVAQPQFAPMPQFAAPGQPAPQQQFTQPQQTVQQPVQQQPQFQNAPPPWGQQ